ncbi:MAG TPA: CopD family protein [Trinickia sp.]|jgi:putative copper resistance protein D|nr:CopD family protein [Trinickia sp.]
MSDHGLAIGRIALAALANIAFSIAVGSALVERWLAVEGALPSSAPSHTAWQRARGSLIAAALVLVLAYAGWLLYQTASMSGTGLRAAIGFVPMVLRETHVGQAWCIAFGGAVLLFFAAIASSGGRFGQAAFWVAVAVAAAGRASIGHAGDAGPWSAAVGIHAIHVFATAVWGGIVLAGGLAVLPALDASTTRGTLIRVAGRLSKTSLIAFGVVVLTGALNAERALGGTLAPLQASGWGHVLTLKLSLVLLAVLLGGLNRLSALPRLRRTASTMDAHTFNNVLHLEALVMIGIFIAAAVLANSAPG